MSSRQLISDCFHSIILGMSSAPQNERLRRPLPILRGSFPTTAVGSLVPALGFTLKDRCSLLQRSARLIEAGNSAVATNCPLASSAEAPGRLGFKLQGATSPLHNRCHF